MEQKKNVLQVEKSGNKIKIGLPVLCDYEDDEDEPKISELSKEKSSNKNQPEEKKRSGLLSLLPPPKSNNNPFNKKSSEISTKQTCAAQINSKEIDNNILMPRSLIKQNKHKQDNQSFNDQNVVKKMKTNFIEDKMPSVNIEKIYEEEDNDYDYKNSNDEIQNDEINDDETSNFENSAKAVFDKEALIKLCGSQGKRNNPELIQITEVSAQEIVGNNKSELIKQITSDYKPPSNKEYFGSSSRRTHQITYLAKVAVERDQELKNAWAQNKFNRQQAKKKYGF